MSKRNKSMTTRSDNKKAKWTRGISEEDKDFNNFPDLLGYLFDKIHEQMGKAQPLWDKRVDEYLHWSNEGPQLDPCQCLQKKGPYSGYTLSLSLCKRTVLATKTGKEVSNRFCTPWVTVKESSYKDAGLGLFAAKPFKRNEVDR